eukprot:GFUD01028775.1.p1 GENE.GFUD01028775.1~~GFUD01028775.1.p1  ORF type:complete len:132 (+),score=12.93 GFUD01028775.1:145-540(+)
MYRRQVFQGDLTRNILFRLRMMIFNPLYLLLCSAWFVAISESSIGIIDCTGMRGTVHTMETWTCDESGGSKCEMRTEDCDEGHVISGTTHYLSNGVQYSSGPGWDCRMKCWGLPRSSGSQQKTNTVACYHG